MELNNPGKLSIDVREKKIAIVMSTRASFAQTCNVNLAHKNLTHKNLTHKEAVVAETRQQISPHVGGSRERSAV